MIYGIGTDIVENDRIRKLLDVYGDKFLQKILSPEECSNLMEINNDANMPSYIAKRFAAKEAFAKALGTGIGSVLSFHDISISNNLFGRPEIKVSDKIKIHILHASNSKSNDIRFFLSLSDEKAYSIAMVIIELRS